MIKEKLFKTSLYDKDVHTMLTSGQLQQHVSEYLLHTNIPKSAKRQSSHECLFAIWDLHMYSKAARKMLVKMLPRRRIPQNVCCSTPPFCPF